MDLFLKWRWKVPIVTCEVAIATGFFFFLGGGGVGGGVGGGEGTSNIKVMVVLVFPNRRCEQISGWRSGESTTATPKQPLKCQWSERALTCQHIGTSGDEAPIETLLAIGEERQAIPEVMNMVLQIYFDEKALNVTQATHLQRSCNVCSSYRFAVMVEIDETKRTSCTHSCYYQGFHNADPVLFYKPVQRLERKLLILQFICQELNPSACCILVAWINYLLFTHVLEAMLQRLLVCSTCWLKNSQQLANRHLTVINSTEYPQKRVYVWRHKTIVPSVGSKHLDIRFQAKKTTCRHRDQTGPVFWNLQENIHAQRTSK